MGRRQRIRHLARRSHRADRSFHLAAGQRRVRACRTRRLEVRFLSRPPSVRRNGRRLPASGRQGALSGAGPRAALPNLRARQQRHDALGRGDHADAEVLSARRVCRLPAILSRRRHSDLRLDHRGQCRGRRLHGAQAGRGSLRLLGRAFHRTRGTAAAEAGSRPRAGNFTPMPSIRISCIWTCRWA